MKYDYTLYNPFNSNAWFPDIDPMYLKTAEDVDFVYAQDSVPEIANIQLYAEANLLQIYHEKLALAIETGSVPLNRTTNNVPCPTAARLTDCRIKRIETTRKASSEASPGVFTIDAVVIAEIEIAQPKNRNVLILGYDELISSGIPYESSHVQQWYRIRGYHDLVENISDPVQSIMIYDKQDKQRGRGLSDCLIPIIPKTDMEEEAERLLVHRKMSYAVNNVCQIHAMKVARNMGLKVIQVRLSKGYRIRGELFLHDASVRYYKEDGTEAVMNVKAGTILYDAIACGTPERIEETIIHECIHYEEHFLFYKLQREYNDNLEYLACIDRRFEKDNPEDIYEQWQQDENCIETDYFGTDENRKKWTAVEWAEWQARELTPRVKLPAKQTKIKIQSLIAQYGHFPHKSKAELYERIIPALAKFYGVSWTVAKIRMIELGFEEARGAKSYIDGKYIPAYTTSTGRIASGTTYDISINDAKKLYGKDPVFAALLDSGSVVYVESHYCVNHADYVSHDKKGPHLTDFARQNIDRCCILFKISYRHRGSIFDKEALHNDKWKNDPVAMALASIPLDVLLQRSADMDSAIADLPSTFGATLKHHRKAEGLTQEELAERLDISRETLARYETAKKPSITKQMIVRMGLELQLPGEFTEDMLSKVELNLRKNDEEDKALSFVAYYLYVKGLEVCNAFLAGRNFLPLGSRKKNMEAS